MSSGVRGTRMHEVCAYACSRWARDLCAYVHTTYIGKGVRCGTTIHASHNAHLYASDQDWGSTAASQEM